MPELAGVLGALVEGAVFYLLEPLEMPQSLFFTHFLVDDLVPLHQLTVHY